jgi:hypothetical protein
MKKRILLSLTSLIGGIFSFSAQMPSMGFAVQAGGQDRDQGYAIAVDQNNDYFVTGYIRNAAQFNTSSGAINLTAVGDYDIFVAKYNSNGHAIWAWNIGNTGGAEFGQDIICAQNGDFYLVGQFEGTIDFNPASGVANRTSNGGEDFYIAKYNGSGQFLWCTTYGGTSDDEVQKVSVDSNGDIYLAGLFRNTIDFNPQGTSQSRTSVGSSDIYLLKLNNNGDFIWVNTFGSSGADTGASLAIDSQDNVWLGGSFRNTIDFDPGTGVANLTSNGGGDIFFAKYNSNGDYIFAGGFGNTASESARAIAVDNNDNLILTGYFDNIIDADAGPGVTNLSSFGDDDIVMAKYDPQGNFLWAKNIGGASVDGDRCYAVVVDDENSIFLGGYFSGTADFDPSVSVFNLTSAGDRDGFIAKYDDGGNYEWAFKIGTVLEDMCYDVVIDNFQTVLATGYFNGQADFNPGVADYTITSYGVAPPVIVSDDIFFARYSSSSLSASVVDFLPSCYNGTNGGATVTINGGIPPYTIFWSNGETGNSVNNLAPGNHSVTVTDNVSNNVQIPFTVNQPLPPSICMVTVDTVLSNHNIIIWEKDLTVIDAIDSFIVYREISGSYVQIGAVHCDSLSLFEDFSADPNVSQHRYKLGIKDTCGTIGELSDFHTTIHLQYLQNGNFQWTAYEIENISNPVASYNFYRDDNSSGTFPINPNIIISTGTTYTDIDYLTYPNARYIIDVNWLNSLACEATRANINTSRSNTKGIAAPPIDVINEMVSNLITLTPNPTNGAIRITLPDVLLGQTMVLTNAVGQILQTTTITSTSVEYDLSNLADGIYFVRVQTHSGVITKKIVKN